jgi:NAD(P)H-hydrate epimerase
VPCPLPRRDRAGQKGDYGHALVVAGCRGYTGAAYLTSQAALRTGSGLVTLAVPAAVYPILAVKLTEAIVVPVRDTTAGTLGVGAAGDIMGLLARADVLAIGPGLSTDRRTGSMLRSLLPRVRCPVVLDADGLNLLARDRALWGRRAGDSSWVLTPHPGEMGRLAGLTVAAVQADRRGVAERFARRHRVVVVLKGYRTVVLPGSVSF